MSKNSPNRSSSGVYDKTWAESVVAEFKTAYPHASQVFSEFWKLEVDFPTNLLRFNQPAWERYKFLVKRIAKVLERFPGPVLPEGEAIEEITAKMPGWVEEAKSRQLFRNEHGNLKE